MAALEFHDVSKSFGAVRALRGVSFSVAEGEAHALVGENGAGKSTLLKILAGILQPDRGEVRWRGEKLHLGSPREALERGIGMVYQEMLSFPNLSVTANIFAGRELTRFGRLRHAEMRERTRGLLSELHLPVSPDALAESLSTAYRQLLQVARALAFDCRILVLDEPTTSLTDAETEHLFGVLERLKQRGVTLLYVSHRLPEVFQLCEQITVLRDGAHVGTFDRAALTPDDVVRAMVGRELPTRAVEAEMGSTTKMLEVERLTRRSCFEEVSMTVNAGEIVGLFGLVGSGRSELLETIFGLYTPDAGTIKLGGQAIATHSPRAAARAGIALVPEERHRQGLLFNLTIRHNLVLPEKVVEGAIRVRPGPERRQAEALLSTWRIKAPGVEVTPDSLSGGNQQKIVLAKWLATKPRLLLLDEPTSGVSALERFPLMEALMGALRQRRITALFVEHDMDVVARYASRVLVWNAGNIMAEGRPDEVFSNAQVRQRVVGVA
jgi:rhamnose transport system ATP-binding protein